jgi:hypothetical protein
MRTDKSANSIEPKHIIPANNQIKWDHDAIDQEGKNYYKDVFAFMNRVRQTRDRTRVKQSLDRCLRGETELW